MRRRRVRAGARRLREHATFRARGHRNRLCGGGDGDGGDADSDADTDSDSDADSDSDTDSDADCVDDATPNCEHDCNEPIAQGDCPAFDVAWCMAACVATRSIAIAEALDACMHDEAMVDCDSAQACVESIPAC